MLFFDNHVHLFGQGEKKIVKRLSAHHRLAAVAMSLLAAILACSAPAAGQNTSDVAELATNTPATDGSGSTEVVAVPTNAPAATSTTAPGVTPSATSCLYNSVYVADLTIPDGTEIQVGDTFTKSWRIKNNGCQVWPNGTTLIFVSGNQMNGPANVPVPETAVGGTQDVSVNLKAPGPAGDFQGYWQLRTPSGIQFGDKVFVKIKSINPTETPEPPTKTPTPGPAITYDANYVGGMWWCSGSPNLYNYSIRIKNTSTLTFESFSWSLDSPPGTHINNGNNNSGFATTSAAASCSDSALSSSSVAPGATAWINAFKPNSALPGGQAARIKIKICTEDDLGGVCKSVTINITT